MYRGVWYRHHSNQRRLKERNILRARAVKRARQKRDREIEAERERQRDRGREIEAETYIGGERQREPERARCGQRTIAHLNDDYYSINISIQLFVPRHYNSKDEDSHQWWLRSLLSLFESLVTTSL
jgi:hypothetical protein